MKAILIDETVQDYPEKPGEYIPAPGNKGVIMCCPGCGKLSAPRDNTKHIYNPETKSVQPSIVHDQELGGCGWHGHLTNGEFIPV